ncbi:hypothetical protein G5V59_26095 [Nocardioides sp. W3-2-3]|uniref:hypothetical protein n=1 Tax=Nocardioides convexus TaxID=2712224 RepID=UPI0024185C1B|nr:hypothetical protein [Nocardioides convexus]NHA01926.1 hypothetical protein [Nocardioides convexus]
MITFAITSAVTSFPTPPKNSAPRRKTPLRSASGSASAAAAKADCQPRRQTVGRGPRAYGPAGVPGHIGYEAEHPARHRARYEELWFLMAQSPQGLLNDFFIESGLVADVARA